MGGMGIGSILFYYTKKLISEEKVGSKARFLSLVLLLEKTRRR
jgi:hypothetical protein